MSPRCLLSCGHPEGASPFLLPLSAKYRSPPQARRRANQTLDTPDRLNLQKALVGALHCTPNSQSPRGMGLIRL